jgi:hypothetical protein
VLLLVDGQTVQAYYARRAAVPGPLAAPRATLPLSSEVTGMIPRYSRPEMARLWSDENRFATWLEVEIAATEVLV